MKRLLILVALTAIAGSVTAAVTFDHSAHLGYVDKGACDTCHKEGAESIVPDTKVCLECHDEAFVKDVNFPGLKTHGPVWTLNHRPFAKQNDFDCAACHQQQDCLECHTDAGRADEFGELGNNMINVHRSDFHVTHPIAARTNPQLCSSCHENKFCTECHDEFRREDLAGPSHRRGFSSIAVLGGTHAEFSANQCQTCHPDSVLPTHEWSLAHAREARKNLVTCQACHPDGDVCLKCHSATSGLQVNPHPKDWNDIKNRLERASDGKTCRKCH